MQRQIPDPFPWALGMAYSADKGKYGHGPAVGGDQEGGGNPRDRDTEGESSGGTIQKSWKKEEMTGREEACCQRAGKGEKENEYSDK